VAPDYREETSQGAVTYCPLLKALDGDTVVCDFNGNHRSDGVNERIRLIGIDASEMHYSPKLRAKLHLTEDEDAQYQPFALQAKNFWRPYYGQKLRMEWDAQRQDKYGRWLAYLYQGQQNLNERLLAAGLATVYFIPPNIKHRDAFELSEHRAQTNRLGRWSQP
jgi:micrococcal nuclease